jgi:hypothetical protein
MTIHARLGALSGFLFSTVLLLSRFISIAYYLHSFSTSGSVKYYFMYISRYVYHRLGNILVYVSATRQHQGKIKSILAQSPWFAKWLCMCYELETLDSLLLAILVLAWKWFI